MNFLSSSKQISEKNVNFLNSAEKREKIADWRGVIFFPHEGPQVRSIECRALTHIRTADPVKNGTPSAFLPLMGKFMDLTPFSVRIFTLMGKFPDLFSLLKLFQVRNFSPFMGNLTDLQLLNFSPQILPTLNYTKLWENFQTKIK
jgi:hypothetical protein